MDAQGPPDLAVPEMGQDRGDLALEEDMKKPCPDGMELKSGHVNGDFCMDRTEVTVKAYADWCKGQSACNPKTCTTSSTSATQPRNCVTRKQARDYCGGQNKRLPLDAEWMFAAYGQAMTKYPWGGDEKPVPTDLCWKKSAPCDVNQDVDLAGNLREFIEDQNRIRGGTWRTSMVGDFKNDIPPAIMDDTFSDDLTGFRCVAGTTK